MQIRIVKLRHSTHYVNLVLSSNRDIDVQTNTYGYRHSCTKYMPTVLHVHNRGAVISGERRTSHVMIAPSGTCLSSTMDVKCDR